jgi:steroid delta-isomerase-like uncharacterized protein
MGAEENVAILRRWFHEVWNEGRTEIVYEYLDDNIFATGEAESPIRSREEFLAFVATVRGALPDMKVVVEDAFGVDDRVVLRYTVHATHTGNHLGVPATGKKVSFAGISMVRFSNGKIVQGWDSWDQLKLMQQIGAVQVPKARFMKPSDPPKSA